MMNNDKFTPEIYNFFSSSQWKKNLVKNKQASKQRDHYGWLAFSFVIKKKKKRNKKLVAMLGHYENTMKYQYQ